ncbi:MAG: DUF4157 domain-containing protein [Richelia sp. CSU_2_1]|nr:DUF4157 domain-containing protein [Richelia sp. CSU_2_1]
MQMPEPTIQRQVKAGAIARSIAPLQRRSSAEQISQVPPIVTEVLNSPSQPLDAETRRFMEPRFGHDFSQVRVHADDRADDDLHIRAICMAGVRNAPAASTNTFPRTTTCWPSLARRYFTNSRTITSDRCRGSALRIICASASLRSRDRDWIASLMPLGAPRGRKTAPCRPERLGCFPPA